MTTLVDELRAEAASFQGTAGQYLADMLRSAADAIEGRQATVTLVLTPEEAQAVFDRLYVYETEDGYLARSVVARRLLDSGAVVVRADA